MYEISNVTSSFRNLLVHVTPQFPYFQIYIVSSEKFSLAWNPHDFLVFIFRYCNGQFPGFGEYVIPQLQICTVLVLSAADYTESSCLSNIGCNF